MTGGVHNRVTEREARETSMARRAFWILAAILFGTFTPAALRAEQPFDSLKDQVFYFVLADRFENGDPANDRGGDTGDGEADVLRHGFLPDNKAYYHGGDLKGLTSRLDYLDELGITAVWFGPMFKNKAVQGDGTIAGSSSGYHGYWTLDFTRIDPHFGSNQDLRDLIEAAHGRDIKVFFDIIVNHTADVIKYRECHDRLAGSSGNGTEDLDGDGVMVGWGGCDYRSTLEYPFTRRGGTGPEINPGFPAEDLTAADFDALQDMTYAFTPYIPFADAEPKVPVWLNDLRYYHNRGDSTFAGENSVMGDFFGLDDLFTEHPDVLAGMVDIYTRWIADYGVDGFRMDTVKHVNVEFWQQFVPAIQDVAARHGKPDFFMFGEVYDGSAAQLSRFTTEGGLPAVLDFGFQGAVRAVVAENQPTDVLRRFFASDDYYTDADSEAGLLPTFVGNHDMGRIGYFIRLANPEAEEAEILARARLAHGLMFFARGIPVVYYGDEQGFVGDGKDQDARQNMFPARVASYLDDDLIGSDATTGEANFDRDHPLYRAIATFAQVREEHRALRRGQQIHRLSEDGPGIYAFSRIDAEEGIEYLVALNSSTEARSVSLPVAAANQAYAPVFGTAAAATSGADARLAVRVPPLDLVIYRAGQRVAAAPAPKLRFAAPRDGEAVTGRLEICVAAATPAYGSVAFSARIGGEDLDRDLGRDFSPAVFEAGDGTTCPTGEAVYRGFLDTTAFPHGATVDLAATFASPDGSESRATAKVELAHKRPSVVLRYENGNRRSGFYGISDSGRVIFPKPLDKGSTARFAWPEGSADLTLFFESQGEDGLVFDRPVTLNLRRDVAPAAQDRGQDFVAELYLNDAHQIGRSENFDADGKAPPAKIAVAEDLPTPFGETALYVRGGMNTWTTDDPLTYGGRGLYEAVIELDAGIVEHKFADAEWREATNFGTPFSAAGLKRGGGSGNLALEVDQGGRYRFQLFSLPGAGPEEATLTFYRVAPLP